MPKRANSNTEKLADKLASSRPTTPQPAFRSPAKERTHRITLDLSPEQYKALKQYAYESDTTMADTLRNLITKWMGTPNGRSRS